MGDIGDQRLTMFYRMQHNMVCISPADYLATVQLSRSRSGHDQMYQAGLLMRPQKDEAKAEARKCEAEAEAKNFL